MNLIGFSLAVLLIELTPGPNMGWLVALTLSEGRRAGLAAMVGIALGLACNAAISVLAASFILGRSELLAQGIAVLGAAMMAWLAYQAWRDAGDTSTSLTPSDGSQRDMLAGFAINLLNPKAALFFVTVMPQFVDGGRPDYAQALALGAISVGIATLVHLALILGADRIRGLIMHPVRERRTRRVLAVAMLAVGAWFLLKAFA